MRMHGTVLHAAALLCAASLAAAQGTSVCAEVPPQRALADFGYAAIACRDCEIDSRAPVWIIFHTPPGLRDVRPGGPAFGKLADDDTLLAIDGMDITSAKGSERYSTVKPGERVTFTVRRKGAPVTTSIVADTKCVPGMSPSSGVRAGVMYGEIVRRPSPPSPNDSRRGWLGVAISTGVRPESIATQDALSRPFPTFLLVRVVAPNGPAALAGIAAGDRLIAVNGLSLLTTEGATRFRNPVPGIAMSVTYIRNGDQLTTTIIPSAAPAEPPMIRRIP